MSTIGVYNGNWKAGPGKRALLDAVPSDNDPDAFDMVRLMNEYRETYGQVALLNVYAECGNDWKKTVQAIREVVVRAPVSVSCIQDSTAS